MNRLLGFMNVLLVALFLLALFVSASDPAKRAIVYGAALAFIPLTFTMFALEPRARFLRTAIAANALWIALYFIGAGFTAAIEQYVFLTPFLLNLAGLTRIWLVRRHELAEAGYESGAADPDWARPSQFDRPEFFDRSEPASGNYFIRHWRGDLSLPISYWVNGWTVTAVCVGLIYAASTFLEGVSLRASSVAVLVLNALLLVAGCWTTVGAWRSAGRHVERGGAQVWAVAVQILVVLGAFGTVTNFFVRTLPQSKEYWFIAMGRDPVGVLDAKVSGDGRVLMLSGAFGAGSAGTVKALLENASEVTTVSLDSPGGRIVEAVRVAEQVNARGLNTYVETHCESACTLVFLAGAERAATPTAQIGFHSASFPGMDAKEVAAMNDDLSERYRSAGLPDDFLSRITATSSSEMWYPTQEELLEAQVVSRVSAGGEIPRLAKFDSKAYLAFQYAGDPIMGAINDHFRGAVDTAASNAWLRYQRGESEAAMWTAAREVILDYYSKLVVTADDASVRSYLQIRLDQLRAAKDVSEQICALHATSSLDIAKGLPPDYYARELSWVKSAIASSGQPPNVVKAAQWQPILDRLAEQLGPEVVGAARNPGAYPSDPAHVCNSTLEFYEAVRALPLGERTIASRALFQGVSE